MTRDATDCRALAEALAGRRLAGFQGQLRLGVPARSHWDNVDAGVLARCREAVEILAESGIAVREIEMPGAEHIGLAAMVMTGTERLPQLEPAWVENVFPTLAPTVRGVIKSRFILSANLLQRVMRFRTMLRRAAADLFGSVDIVVMPTSPVSPPPVDRPRAELPSGITSPDVAVLPYVGWANLTGIPAITVPCGFDSTDMPVGLSLHGAWGREGLLLDVAERFEQLTDNAYTTTRAAACQQTM